MKTIGKEYLFYSFGKDLKPALSADSGETLVFETKDCFSDQISKPSDFDVLDWNHINPATGPVFINGAEKGDVLKVEIINIEINDRGAMCVAPGAGVLGDGITAAEARMIPVKDNMIIFNDKIKLPLKKMIGVIGVAPEGDDVLNGTPGCHGGNMDTKVIKEGASLYLPVFRTGALFGLGDLHAAMGDGEVCVSGVEICGKVTVKLSVIKGKTIKNPIVEDSAHIYTIASAPSMEVAAKECTGDMAALLTEKTGLSLAEATMLMSAAGNLQFSQVVDPLVTLRFAMPKSVLEGYFTALF